MDKKMDENVNSNKKKKSKGKYRKKQGNEENFNPNKMTKSRFRKQRIQGENETLTHNEIKKLAKKNRKKKRSTNTTKKTSIYLLEVPEYPIPGELFKVLKRNLEQYAGISEQGEEWRSFLKRLPEVKDIEETDYLKMLKNLMYVEDYYNEEAMKQFNLYKQKILRSSVSRGQFVILVPGLADDRPSVMPKDLVEVQKVGSGYRRIYKLRVTYVGLSYVTVTANAKFKEVYDESNLYDVKFLYSNWPIRVCHFAIDLIKFCKLTPLLYPVVNEVSNQPKKDLFWFDENIKNNFEQMQAVERILGRTSYPSPYLVFGPPGTGKTATIVEAISQIWQSDKLQNKVLVCTPSNAAADEITTRLLCNVPKDLIYRMLSSAIEASDVDKKIHGCAHFVGGEVDFLPLEVLMKKSIIITTLITCMRLKRMLLNPNFFTYIFIDEAGQATQPESLIPLGLIRRIDGQSHSQLVLSGDPKQLGPVIMTKLGQNLLGKSMLERFMDCSELYQKDEEDKYDPNFITKLLKNYRSQEAILRIPNQLFYDNELVTCVGKHISIAENWPQLPNKKFPLIFHAVHGLEEKDNNSPSVCNEAEVEIVIDYVTQLLGATLGKSKIEEKNIGIVTPFRLQRTVILKALEEKKWNDISVGTVETFQGKEKEIIIVSTVRSILLQHDGRFHLGFLSDDKRFNVTITRAKSLLIVIGNPKILQIDNCWQELIKYCQENEACVGDKFTLSIMSKDEKKQLLNSTNIAIATTQKKDKDRKLKLLRPKVKTQKTKTKEKTISLISAKQVLEFDFRNCSSFNIEERFKALKLGGK